MASLRRAKTRIRELLERDDWQAQLAEIASDGKTAVGALLALLPGNPELMHRAACALGRTVALIYAEEPEAARNIMRRFMWHMNEDSGNIGWGIPAAFAETLAACAPLAKEYAHILISYIMDLGIADNYCDHAILRRDCYWAAGRLAQAWPQLAEKARPWLVKGLQDEDEVCRGMAAWALAQLPPDIMDAPALKRLADAGDAAVCEVFTGGKFVKYAASELAQMACGKDMRAAKA